MKNLGLFLAVVAVTGCAIGQTGLGPNGGIIVPAPGPGAEAVAVEPPMIQVREYPRSSIVSVVAWEPEAAAYGLRAQLRRDGSLVRDHRFYVSPYYIGYDAPITQPFVSAAYRNRGVPSRTFIRTTAPANRQLQSNGMQRDDRACYFGSCTPFERFEVRVPDDLLRANRDSLALTFYARGGQPAVITVRRDLIDPYLAAVDSVTAALRKK